MLFTYVLALVAVLLQSDPPVPDLELRELVAVDRSFAGVFAVTSEGVYGHRAVSRHWVREGDAPGAYSRFLAMNDGSLLLLGRASGSPLIGDEPGGLRRGPGAQDWSPIWSLAEVHVVGVARLEAALVVYGFEFEPLRGHIYGGFHGSLSAPGYVGVVYLSCDEGATWTQLLRRVDGAVVAVAKLGADLACYRASGELLIVRDFAQPADEPETVGPFPATPLDWDQCLISAEAGGLWLTGSVFHGENSSEYSSDAGASWAANPFPHGANPIDVLLAPSGQFVLRSDRSVSVLTDSGKLVTTLEFIDEIVQATVDGRGDLLLRFAAGNVVLVEPSRGALTILY